MVAPMTSTLTAKQMKKLVSSVSSSIRSELPKNGKPKPGSRRARKNKRAQRGMSFGMNLGSGAMAPAAVSSAWGLTKPKFVIPAVGGCIRIQHSEFYANLSGATTFTAQSVSLNPGLASTFPWLSSLANNFESYVFHSLRVVFRTMKGTSTNGEVILSIDFDAADEVPGSKQVMFSYEGTVKSAPWENLMYSASKGNLRKSLTYYTREGAITNTDVKTYDVGNMILAVDACADTSIIGDIFLEYDVELMTPQLLPIGASQPISQKLTGGAVSNASFLGATPTSAGSTIVRGAVNTLTFQTPGEYLVTVTLIGTVFAAITSAASTATVVQMNAPAPLPGTMTTANWLFRVTATVAGQTLVLDCSGSTTVTGSFTRITQYDNSLTVEKENDEYDDLAEGNGRLWEVASLRNRLSKLETLLERIVEEDDGFSFPETRRRR